MSLESPEVEVAPDNNEQLHLSFVPTPDRLSQYLELDSEETISKLQSVEGRKALFDRIAEHENDLREIYPEFDLESVRHRLDIVADTLQQKEDFLETMDEEKGVMSKAWEVIKNFPKNHPVVTALLAASAAVATVATGFYLAGEWELFMSSLGLDSVFGGADAAGELILPTPSTPALPGGGIFEVPPPSTPPGAIPGLDTVT